MPDDRRNWNRGWIFYRVQAVLAEKESGEIWPDLIPSEKEAYEKNVLDRWHGHVFELSSPILCGEDIRSVIKTNDFRIYPPFRLNRKSRIAHSFDEVSLPSEVGGLMEIPSFAVRGIATELRHSESYPAYGLRIDHRDGIAIAPIFESFLQLIRQYTKQWWVSSPRDPFDAGLRMSFQLRGNFEPRDILKFKGAGEIKAPWYGAGATQNFVGIEEALNSKIWSNVATCVASGYGLDSAVSFYLDAINDYMGFRDDKCIMNLALLFETCENKILLMEGKSIKSKNKQLLKTTNLAKGLLKDTFRKIVTDRDNIAHGRSPINYRSNPNLILEYLTAATSLVESYLDKCQLFGWDKAVKISI